MPTKKQLQSLLDEYDINYKLNQRKNYYQQLTNFITFSKRRLYQFLNENNIVYKQSKSIKKNVYIKLAINTFLFNEMNKNQLINYLFKKYDNNKKKIIFDILQNHPDISITNELSWRDENGDYTGFGHLYGSYRVHEQFCDMTIKELKQYLDNNGLKKMYYKSKRHSYYLKLAKETNELHSKNINQLKIKLNNEFDKLQLIHILLF